MSFGGRDSYTEGPADLSVASEVCPETVRHYQAVLGKSTSRERRKRTRTRVLGDEDRRYSFGKEWDALAICKCKIKEGRAPALKVTESGITVRNWIGVTLDGYTHDGVHCQTDGGQGWNSRRIHDIHFYRCVIPQGEDSVTLGRNFGRVTFEECIFETRRGQHDKILQLNFGDVRVRSCYFGPTKNLAEMKGNTRLVFEEDHPSIAHDIRTIVQADGNDGYRTLERGDVRVDVRGLQIRGRNKEMAGKGRRLKLRR